MSQKPSDDRASYLYGRDLAVDRRYRPCPDMRVNLYQNMIEEDAENDSHTNGDADDETAAASATQHDANKENSCGNGATAASSSTVAATAAADADATAAAVVLRLRPTANKCPEFTFERNIFKHRTAPTTDCNQAKVPEKQFRFHSIFADTTTQAVVYQTCVQDAIENDDALTVMTYGTSGSGKTHTLFGIHSDNPGIIPRAIEHIFARYEAHVCASPAVKIESGTISIVPDDRMRLANGLRHALIGRKATAAATAAAQQQATTNGCSAIDRSAEAYAQHRQRIHEEHSFALSPRVVDTSVFIWVSFAEIYNESVYDLLPTPPPQAQSKANAQQQQQHQHPGQNQLHPHPAQHQKPRKTLKVISNDGNAFIKNLNSVHCRSAQDAYQLLTAGLANITYASTNINQNSSRSHCIFFVDVIIKNDRFKFEHVAYKFCDLAGSERQKKTDNVGNRLKEAQSINNSLMVLGRCLDAVYHKKSTVPIRDSKLTVLLQASLLGKEKIKMIVNMQPSAEYLDENLNVLNFASMAKQIVYKPPTQEELRKRSRKTARYSWFIENAPTSSSPVKKKAKKGTKLSQEQHAAAAAVKALMDGGANKTNAKASNGAAADGAAAAAVDEQSDEYMGDTTQISLLLDENDRLKMDNEELLDQLDQWPMRLEEREREVRSEMIAEMDQRAKTSQEFCEKRIALNTRKFETQIRTQQDNHNRIVARLERRIEQLEQQLLASASGGPVPADGEDGGVDRAPNAETDAEPDADASARRSTVSRRSVLDLTADSSESDTETAADEVGVVQELVDLVEDAAIEDAGHSAGASATEQDTVFDLTAERTSSSSSSSSSDSESDEEVEQMAEFNSDVDDVPEAEVQNEQSSEAVEAGTIELVVNEGEPCEEPPEKRNRLSE